MVYNDKGRVTTFGFNIFDFNDAADMVSYNSDGTIAAYTNNNQTDSSYQQFSYSNGQYELHVRGAVKNGENIVYDTIVYNIAADGTPISARFVERYTGEQSDLGCDYTVNQRGLVDSMDFTYVKSPEPVPNMIGFMMITKGGFRIHL